MYQSVADVLLQDMIFESIFRESTLKYFHLVQHFGTAGVSGADELEIA